MTDHFRLHRLLHLRQMRQKTLKSNLLFLIDRLYFQDDPDANEKFVKINKAYEVLKDEDLRKKYDMYGEEGLSEDGPSGRGFQSWNFYNQDFGNKI